MYKHDVIHESGSTKHIATLPEEDRATSIGNKKVGEVWTYSSALPEVRVRTYRQTGPTRKHTLIYKQRGAEAGRTMHQDRLQFLDHKCYNYDNETQ